MSIISRNITSGFSLEVTPKDISALAQAAPAIEAGSLIAIPYLPGDREIDLLAAARVVQQLGFEPMPHISARRIGSPDVFGAFVENAVSDAGITHCLVLAGDPPIPAGPFVDSASLIATGIFERAGIRTIGIAGHPEGHPKMSEEQCWAVLTSKCRSIEDRGMTPLIVTQFTFDADTILTWLETLRARGLDCPVRVGVAGPAGVKTLMRFATRCGVGASASMLSKYGISIGRLLGKAGPENFVERLSAGLCREHGSVQLHFYPFGGVAGTVEWIERYVNRMSPYQYS